VDRITFTFAVVVSLLVLITLWRPEFWTVRGELPFDADDPTRGDWREIPDQGHPEDTDTD
jgi:hypothetical protein